MKTGNIDKTNGGSTSRSGLRNTRRDPPRRKFSATAGGTGGGTVFSRTPKILEFPPAFENHFETSQKQKFRIESR